MKKILLATAMAALTAAPAFAQQVWMGQPAPAPVNPYASSWSTGYGPQYGYGAVRGPYAAVGATGSYMTQPGFAPNAVFSIDGQYIGSDPDPFIQNSLRRDEDILLGRGPTG